MKVVLDTNILISAFLSGKGAPAMILRLEREGRFDLVFSPATVEEHWRVLRSDKIRKRLAKLQVPFETVERFLMNLIKSSQVVPGKLKVVIIESDPSDTIFLACAKEGHASFIVSGDQHLKELKTFEGIPILEPTTFLDVMGKPSALAETRQDALNSGLGELTDKELQTETESSRGPKK